MFNPIRRFKEWFVRTAEKKKYLDLVTAMLSVPVLLSVIFINYMNIQDKRSPEDNLSTGDTNPAIITIIQREPSIPVQNNSGIDTTDPTPTQKPLCIDEVGPVEIISPEEGATVEANPLSISIFQQDPQNEYCAVVWSYRINGGPWSNFDDKDISVFNMDSGEKTLEVRVKSLISGDEVTLTRRFTYENSQQIATPTDEPPPTASPTVTPAPTESES